MIEIRKGKREKLQPGVYNAAIIDVQAVTKAYGAKSVPGIKLILKITDDNVKDGQRRVTAAGYYQSDDYGVYLDPDKRLYKWLSNLYGGDTGRIKGGNFKTDLLGLRCTVSMIQDGENVWPDDIKLAATQAVSAAVIQQPSAPLQSPAPVQQNSASTKSKLNDIVKNDKAEDDLMSLLDSVDSNSLDEFK